MPIRVKTLCPYPGCATLTLKGRCDRHRRLLTKKRPSSTAMGYDRTWQKIRLRYLREHPFCEIRIKCRGNAAKHVDHKRPKSSGGGDEFDNLQAACLRCHSSKTARYDRQRTEEGRFA